MVKSMNITLYIIIFIAKVIENALGTVRLIVVANGKRLLGAILNGIMALLWVATTGIVVKDLKKDPITILFFALGSFAGSYIGSYIEQKMALGSNMLTAIVNIQKWELITNKIRDMGYAVTTLNGEEKDTQKKVLLIMITRKQRKKIVEQIKKLDRNAMIVAENAFTIKGGYQKK